MKIHSHIDNLRRACSICNLGIRQAQGPEGGSPNVILGLAEQCGPLFLY